jgi:TRAP transporter TAXI family solute receptor
MKRLAIVTLLAGVIAAPTTFAQTMPPTVSLGSTQPGTLQHGIATGLARAASGKAGTTVVVQPFTGSSTMLPLLNTGELDFGLAPSTDAALSYLGPDNLKIDGQNPYPRARKLRVVMSGSPLIASLIVRKDSPIKSANDLRGKRVAGEFRGSLGAYINTFVHLQSAGMGWKDVTVVPFAGLNEALEALGQGRVDATVFGVGGARIREVDAQFGVRFVSSNCDAAGKARIATAAPGYYAMTMAPGSAPGIVDELCTTAYAMYLLAGDDVPAHVVTAVLKGIWDEAATLGTLHPGLREWKRETAVDGKIAAPYHPAAIAFYKAQNLWTPTAEADQQKLLAIR